MKQTFILLIILFSNAFQFCFAADDSIKIKAFYTRSFHGTIAIEINSQEKSKDVTKISETNHSAIQELGVKFKLYDTKGNEVSEFVNSQKHSIKQNIKLSDIERLLGLVSDPELQAYFSNKKYDTFLDGSSFSISVEKNLYALAVRGHNLLDGDVHPAERKLGEILIELLKVVGYSIEKESLY